MPTDDEVPVYFELVSADAGLLELADFVQLKQENQIRLIF